jgi:sulfate/thiosulfate transport system substrate-binding protein
MRRISLALLLALVFPALAVGAAHDAKLTLVAYSTPREAYGQLIPAFQKTPAGKDIGFSQSYGASGEQSRAVAAGLQADIVAFSLAPDISELVKKGLVAQSWNKDKYHGMVTRSVVVFVVRDGNPKKLKTWNDLLKPGVQIVTPNPFTSGGARWNVMAAYGGALRAGMKPKQAQSYLAKMWKHVVAQPASAREGLQTFLARRGDVFLAYENEALFARTQGQDLQFVIPKSTILIENPIAVVKSSSDREKANQFLRYLRMPAAQQILADNGYRPVVKRVLEKNRKKFPVRPGQFTIEQLGLGGWDKVQKRFFDPKAGIMARIERQVGGVTG